MGSSFREWECWHCKCSAGAVGLVGPHQAGPDSELIEPETALGLLRPERIRMPPTLANGKICYIEIPANDISRSADFYGRVFGWKIRQRGDGHTAFDDATGEVSGTWVPGRSPAEPGLVIYVMVDSMAATLDAVVAAGGEIVQSIGKDAPRLPPGSATPQETSSASTRNRQRAPPSSRKSRLSAREILSTIHCLYGSGLSAALWSKPFVAALADKVVIVQIRISVIDAIDLLGLAWTERLCRIQAPDAF